MKKFLLLLMVLLLLTGCATTQVYQIQGVPVPDKVIQAKIFGLGATVTYNLSKTFTIKEEDESYRSFEHLSLFDDIHKINKDETVVMNLSVFNPNRSHYKIEQHAMIQGGGDYNIVVYNGNLSRNKITFRLPVKKSSKVVFYFDVYDMKDDLVYQSFRAQYIIEG
jgi:hypothetical protein